MAKMNWDRVRAENTDRTHRDDPILPTLHGQGCWCGQPVFHDWPGKADGAPHPRMTRED